ncbi:MAG: transketolase [Firmicutes bacterium]|nr:transketolase [Bacillota bacterium]
MEALKVKAQQVRESILRMVYAANSGHCGGSLSAADLVTALYFHIMRVNPQDPNWEDRDRFILSKGHACPVIYAALALRGYFPQEELGTLRAINSRLQGHPDMRKTPGLDATTGSLGQGLSLGVGMALAAKIGGKGYRVYVLMGDGETNEGQIWEAAACAAKYGLNNLVGIVDENGLQNDGPTDAIMPMQPLAEKWRAFGWNVLEIDGHDMEQIVTALEQANESNQGKPTAIIAKTVKGKGVSFMENVVEWHSGAPTDAQLEQALDEIWGRR